MTTKILWVLTLRLWIWVSEFVNKESGVMRIDCTQKLHVSLHTIIQVSHGAVSTLHWCGYDGGHYEEAFTLEAFLWAHVLPKSHVAEKLLKADPGSCPPSHRAQAPSGMYPPIRLPSYGWRGVSMHACSKEAASYLFTLGSLRRSLVGYSPRVTKSRTGLSDFTFTLT